MINQFTKAPHLNNVIEVTGSSHIFYGMHDIYAETVLGCVNKAAKSWLESKEPS